MNFGRFTFKQVDQVELPDPYQVKGSEFSPYFVFKNTEQLDVLHSKWFLGFYLKGLLRGKFRLSHGRRYFYVRESFIGLFRTPAEIIAADLEYAMYVGGQDLRDEDTRKLNRKDLVKAYISIPSKNPGYDLVLGELDENKKITKIYRCKRIFPGNKLQIVRESQTKTDIVKITSQIWETI